MSVHYETRSKWSPPATLNAENTRCSRCRHHCEGVCQHPRLNCLGTSRRLEVATLPGSACGPERKLFEEAWPLPCAHMRGGPGPGSDDRVPFWHRAHICPALPGRGWCISARCFRCWRLSFREPPVKAAVQRLELVQGVQHGTSSSDSAVQGPTSFR